MATASAKPMAQLEKENLELLGQIQVLRAKCCWLSSYNQALLDLCLDNQLYPSNIDTPAPCNNPAWTTNTLRPPSAGAQWGTHTDVMPNWDPDPFGPEIVGADSIPSNKPWPYPLSILDAGLQEDLNQRQSARQDVSAHNQAALEMNRGEFWDFSSALLSDIDPAGVEMVSYSTILPTPAAAEVSSYEKTHDPSTGCQSGVNGTEYRRRVGNRRDVIYKVNSSDETVGDKTNSSSMASAGSIPRDYSLNNPENTSEPRPDNDDDELLTLTANPNGKKQPRTLSSAVTTMFPLLPALQCTPNLKAGFNTSARRGRLDRYISVLSETLKRIEATTSLTPKLRKKLGSEGVLWVVREAWPQAEHFWKVTASFQGFLQSELWRNYPGRATYKAMHPAYRPTPTQLSTQHSHIIDWLPWPDLRDKVIEHQDHIDVDLVCKMAIQNVVAHRRTANRRPKRPRGEDNTEDATMETESAKTSFRVWDLCLLEETAGFRPGEDATALVYKPQSASVQALEKAYGLEYDEFQTQKLHPQFFDTFPSLFVETAVSNYTVQQMPAVQKYQGVDELGSPREVSPGAVHRLTEAVERISELAV